MLQYIREKATGWIAWTIIILICIPFALWGVNQYFGPDASLAVARVNDAEIGYYQYRNAYQQQRDRLRQMFGGSLPASMFDDAMLREQTLESLINDELLVQQSLGSGLRVGDAQLANAIRTLPAFQRDGAFSQAVYDGFLRSRGTSPQAFELDLRRSILSEQVITALRRTAIVTEQELEAALRSRNEQRRFRVLRIESDKVSVPEPSDQAVQEWFEAHSDRYVQPERVKVRYVELSRDEIAARVKPDETELRSIYEQNKASYRTAEQREARHILLEVAFDASEEQTQTVRAKIQALRDRIAAGEDFAEVAKVESQDPGSAPLGGSLGYFGRGVMDPAFEEAAFGLEKGSISEPVRSRFGWHLIQVTGIQPETVRSFEDARADVLREYQTRQAEQIFAEQVERLANLAFEHPESLEVASQAVDAELRTSEFFSRSAEGASGIATQAKVREAAFSDEVLNAGNNSELIEIGTSRVLALRVAEREPARPKTLDEVRDEIRAQLRRDAASKKAQEIGGRLIEALRGGASLEESVASEGLTWGDEQTASRENPAGVAPDITQALFKMAPPAGNTARFEGMALPEGDYVVLALVDVAPGTPEPAQAAQTRDRVASRLESEYGDQSLGAVLRALRKSADVEVLQQNLRPDEG